LYPFIAELTNFLEQQQVEFKLTALFLSIPSRDLKLQLLPNLSAANFKREEFELSPCSHNNVISIWEDVYVQNSSIVHSRLLSKLGKSARIYARDTSIITLNQTELDQFLLENHLNVPTRARFKYGLQRHGQLVAVISFGKACPIQRGGVTYRSHELIRYGSLLNHTVTGGLSKLISYFAGQQAPEDIMTYVDRDWSTGEGYKTLDFALVDETPPHPFWVVKSIAQRYYSYAEATSFAIDSADIQKVYNCGSLKLVKFYK
jgi:hypothetical protein